MKREDIIKIELQARRLRSQHLASFFRATFTAIRRRATMAPAAGRIA